MFPEMKDDRDLSPAKPQSPELVALASSRRIKELLILSVVSVKLRSSTFGLFTFAGALEEGKGGADWCTAESEGAVRDEPRRKSCAMCLYVTVTCFYVSRDYDRHPVALHSQHRMRRLIYSCTSLQLVVEPSSFNSIVLVIIPIVYVKPE